MQLKINKVTALPATPDPDSIYFVEAGQYVEAYVTSQTAVPKLIYSSSADVKAVSGAVVGQDIVITMSDTSTFNIDATALLADIRLQSGSYNNATEELELIISDGVNPPSTITIPVGDLLLVSTDNIDGDGSSGNPLKVNPSTDANNAIVLGTDGKPFVDNSTFHTHANKAILDQIGEDANGCLTYNGQGVMRWETTNW